MKISPKQKKWIKRLGILLLLRVLIGGILYYAIVYKFKDIVQLALNVETKGAYQFDAGDIDVKLFKGQLSMKNAYLHFRDSTKHVTHHDVKIPDLQLTIRSFKDLIFHGQLAISNLSITQPSLSTTSFDQPNNKRAGMHASSVVKGLQKMAKHLNIEKFSLEEGSFSYANEKSKSPLFSNRINVRLSGFSKENLNEKKLLGTEEMEISLKNQHWLMPDGKKEIWFKSLQFSVRNQSLDLDSFRIVIRSTDSNHVSFNADKFRIKSKDLMASLEEDDFFIDSVFCVRPILEVSSDGGKKKRTVKVKDTAAGIFDEYRFGFVSISEGELSVKRGNQNPRASVKTDVQLFNLRLTPDGARQVDADSINLALNNLEFFSKDSLFRMAVNNCTFNGNTLVFNGVSYDPTVKNKYFSGLIFHSPRIQLMDINLDRLIHRELEASQAEVYKPEISFYRGRKKKSVTDTSIRQGLNTQLMDNIHSIIDVDEFKVYDGNLDINNPYKQGENISIRNIYATILLNDLMESQNKQGIKAAIPYLTTGSVEIGLPGGNISLKRYVLDGTAAKNFAPEVKVSLRNGTNIIATDVFWYNLNWDMLMDQKHINAETFSIKSLNVELPIRSKNTAANTPKHDIIPITIGSVKIDKIKFAGAGSADNSIAMNGGNFEVKDLKSLPDHFTWEKIKGDLSDITINKPGLQINTENAHFNQQQITLYAVEIISDNENKRQHIKLPVSIVNTSIRTTKPGDLIFQNISLNNPVVTVIQKNKISDEDPRVFKLNSPLAIADLSINNANISITDLSKKDSALVQLETGLRLRNLKIPAGYSPLIDFAELSLTGKAIKIRQHPFRSTVATAKIDISNGNIKMKRDKVAKFTGKIYADWENATADYKKDDSTYLKVQSISGKYDDAKFVVTAGEKLPLKKIARHFSVTGNGINYTHRNGQVDAKEISWNKRGRQMLVVSKFSVMPRLSYEDWSAVTKWQKDYLTVTGEMMQVEGLDYKHEDADSMLRIQKLTVAGIQLTTTKDKRKPFMHGVEKPMPTQMIVNVNLPLVVDSIEVKNSSITITQISEKTNRKGVIPITELNALITGISNTDKPGENFQLKANARILNNYLRYIEYNETYGENAKFEMKAQVSRMQLPGFSPITTPLANIAVAQGNADTLFAEWKGNQYAAYGNMNFHYKKLKVKLLSKEDPEKKSLLLNIENWLANSLVLKKNNDKTALMYSERDKEKFFATYWVKTLLSGVLSTAGLKRDKKYKKAYDRNKKQWGLE
jgi:hypothetical protein